MKGRMAEKSLTELERLRLHNLYLTLEVQRERANHAQTLALTAEKNCQTMIGELLKAYVPLDELDDWQVNVQTGQITPRQPQTAMPVNASVNANAAYDA